MFAIHDNSSGTTSNTFAHFAEDGERVYGVRKTFIVAPREDFEVHLRFCAATVHDASGVMPADRLIVAEVFLLWSRQLAGSISVQKLAFLVLNHFATKSCVVEVAQLLEQSSSCGSVLVDDEPRVKIASHEFLKTPKLHVLKEKISCHFFVLLDHLWPEYLIPLVWIVSRGQFLQLLL
jgi:hypothetical protein